jgi:nitrite reductase/ring-hydroxylating ferredoxin subunit
VISPDWAERLWPPSDKRDSTGDGQIADGYVICPWHAYEYDPRSGEPPPGFKDAAVAYRVEKRADGVYIPMASI